MGATHAHAYRLTAVSRHLTGASHIQASRNRGNNMCSPRPYKKPAQTTEASTRGFFSVRVSTCVSAVAKSRPGSVLAGRRERQELSVQGPYKGGNAASAAAAAATTSAAAAVAALKASSPSGVPSDGGIGAGASAAAGGRSTLGNGVEAHAETWEMPTTRRGLSSKRTRFLDSAAVKAPALDCKARSNKSTRMTSARAKSSMMSASPLMALPCGDTDKHTCHSGKVHWACPRVAHR